MAVNLSAASIADHPLQPATNAPNDRDDARRPGLAAILLRNAWQAGWQSLSLGEVDAAIEQFARAVLLANGNHDPMTGLVMETDRLTHKLRDLALQREQHSRARDATDATLQSVRARLNQMIESNETDAFPGAAVGPGWIGRLLTAAGLRARVADPMPTSTSTSTSTPVDEVLAEVDTQAVVPQLPAPTTAAQAATSQMLSVDVLGSFRLVVGGGTTRDAEVRTRLLCLGGRALSDVELVGLVLDGGGISR